MDYKDGAWPLHKVVSSEYSPADKLKFVRALIDVGANVDAVDYLGNSALDYAIYTAASNQVGFYDEHVVRLLVEGGASRNPNSPLLEKTLQGIRQWPLSYSKLMGLLHEVGIEIEARRGSYRSSADDLENLRLTGGGSLLAGICCGHGI